MFGSSSNIYHQQASSSSILSNKNKECMICGGDDAIINCPNALHHFCSECFENMIRTQIPKMETKIEFFCSIDNCNLQGNKCFERVYVVQHISPQLNVELIDRSNKIGEKNGVMSEKLSRKKEQEEKMKRTPEENKVNDFRKSLEHLANKKCGKCQATWDEFDGCCAVCCNNCGAYICAYCEMNFNNGRECHLHVPRCIWNQTREIYPSSKAALSEANRRCKGQKMQQELYNLDWKTKQLAEKDPAIVAILKDHFVPLTSLSTASMPFQQAVAATAPSAPISVPPPSISAAQSTYSQNIIQRANTRVRVNNPAPTCLKSHNLIGFSVVDVGFTCHTCNQQQSIGARMFQCNNCLYLICSVCEIQLQAELSNSSNVINLVSTSGNFEPAAQGAKITLQQPSNHKLIEGEIYNILYEQPFISTVSLHNTQVNAKIPRPAVAQTLLFGDLMKFVYVDEIGGEEIIDIIKEKGRITKFIN